MRNQLLDIQPIAGALGAEIGGVNLADELGDGVIAEIRQALLDHGVIFFRDQVLDVDRHKAFARRFGDIFIHPNFRGTQADPEVVNVVRNPGDARIVGEKWHHDTTMVAEPPMGAVFYAIEVPPYGGDTMFASQYLAYETLSPGLQALLEGLRVKHTDRALAGPQAGVSKTRSTAVREDADWRETITYHPAVITHPETGRKALFVNHSHCVAFEDMTEEESRPLLDYLLEHGHRPEFTCRFRYTPGSVAFWDNRCVKHIAVNDAGPFRRVARRIQIQGTRPQ
ncbi:TauD/TfdA dioxygenase family protein [Rhodopila sp.]|jgi:taurine dioxygenase|uniref:TauD/TfdA dioxygenase family protein n=1 Tax=Rhodopila sp. TaxID=2480087 RepID=UPI002CFD9F53|nr:TauD/TfdA family dioxygenase [Rhodopila sp.]HVZ08532.1 TauD/TfdA family dioxygenase [Rhodopila sp.]